MKTLIRIVFVIFIANDIDCRGGVCKDCCDCLKKKDENEEIKEYEKIGGEGEEGEDEKEEEENEEENNDENNDKEIKEYEEIKEDENNTAKSLVSDDWFKAKENNKENNLVLKIFKKKDDDAFPSKENGDKISIKLEEKGNPKIAHQDEAEDKLKLKDQKYAFFEIKTKNENTVYLYCSDVESSVGSKKVSIGIFQLKDHKSISVIACDTEKVTNMEGMFSCCSNLTELDLKNFNTTNVENMSCMFQFCNSLTELDLKNFNTSNVIYMNAMFMDCNNLKKITLGNNFNTSNVPYMGSMFWGCSSLKKLKFGKDFNTTNVINRSGMFSECSLPQKTQDKILIKKK